MTGTRAITLHQPWATLVALVVKSIETRSWPAPESAVGERLLIHAAAKVPPVGPWQGGRIMDDMTGERICFLAEPFTEEQQIARGLPPDGDLLGFPMPLGAIVASATLAACVPMVEAGPEDRWSKFTKPVLAITPSDRLVLAGPERAWNWRVVTDQRPYGDFAPGRWAWLLEDVKPTTDRCPACWGERHRPVPIVRVGGGYPDPDDRTVDRACPTCSGTGTCPPVPAKGAQRIWRWEP